VKRRGVDWQPCGLGRDKVHPATSRCGVPSERISIQLLPGLHPGLVCLAPLGQNEQLGGNNRNRNRYRNRDRNQINQRFQNPSFNAPCGSSRRSGSARGNVRGVPWSPAGASPPGDGEGGRSGSSWSTFVSGVTSTPGDREWRLGSSWATLSPVRQAHRGTFLGGVAGLSGERTLQFLPHLHFFG